MAMYKHNWRNGFASGLIVGASAAVVALVAISFMQSPDDFRQSANYENQSENKDYERPEWWLIPPLRRIIAIEDTFAQWLMAVFTILATYFLLRTLWATQEMARDTREIGEAQTRAYLIVSEIQRDQGGFNVVIENIGASPASITHATANVNSSDVGKCEVIWGAKFYFESIGMAPKARHVELLEVEPRKMSYLDRMNDRYDRIITVSGSIHYTDIFKQNRVTSFKYEVGVDTPIPEKLVRAAYGNHVT